MTVRNGIRFFFGLVFTSLSFVAFSQTKNDSVLQNRPTSGFYESNPSSRWIRELKNIIIVPPRNETVDSFNIESPRNIYLDVEGRIITSIRVVRLKPFGSSITDTAMQNLNIIGKTGNAIHVGTGEFIIRNALQFEVGDSVSSFQLAHSERYLRSLSYIDDALITVHPVSTNEAEVIVYVQDVFPYSVDFGTNFATRMNYGITNRNIFGLGVAVSAGAFMDASKDHLMGYEAMLRMPNIGRSLVSFQADYLDRYEYQRYGFALRREFYDPAIKYAGHIVFYDARTPVRYYDHQSLAPSIQPVSIRYSHLDTWLGRSFQLPTSSGFTRQRRNITASIAVQQMHFADRPARSEEHYYRFQDRTTWLASVAFSQQAFFKANRIYNFGRTEDIPYGYLFTLIAGREVNEEYNRPYIGANASAGYFIPRTGYLSGALHYGSFFRRGPHQGVIDLEVNYFSNLYVLGKYRMRTFVNTQYTRQLHHQLDDRLMIEGQHGIPGFRNDSVLGRQRFNLSAEQAFFTPWNLHEFRFVLYAFTYFSWLGEYGSSVMLSPLYSSFGVGIRIRNNRLVFNTLQIQFAYFPNIPRNSRFHYISFSRETVMQPRRFQPIAPDVMPLY